MHTGGRPGTDTRLFTRRRLATILSQIMLNSYSTRTA
jgi:hypothetical protein